MIKTYLLIATIISGGQSLTTEQAVSSSTACISYAKTVYTSYMCPNPNHTRLIMYCRPYDRDSRMYVYCDCSKGKCWIGSGNSNQIEVTK